MKIEDQEKQQLSSGGYPAWVEVAGDDNVNPDVVVAKDGSGQFTTIGQGVAAYPTTPLPLGGRRFVIYVKAGVYDEYIVIDSQKPNILIYGDGIGKTIVTGDKNHGIQGIETSLTATFANEAAGFVAHDMTFRNTAGPEGMQAVAFRCSGDKSAVYRCSFEGYQDTLCYEANLQFYRDCDIYGTIDFIFGQGRALVQHCNIIVRRPLSGQYNTLTADGRENIGSTLGGLVLQKCTIVGDKLLGSEVKTYLGRPWKKAALTMVMESNLGFLIAPEGWHVWEDSTNNQTCDLYEFDNIGPGANTDKRNVDHVFPHFKAITEATDATPFTAAVFLSGQDWLPQTGAPFDLGLTPPDRSLTPHTFKY